SGTVADAHLDRVSVNGVAAPVSAGRFTAASVPLTAGSNTLTATATDLVGNIGTAVVHVTRDDSAVSIAIDTPPPGARLRAQPITVSGPVSASATAATVNGIAATLSGGRFSAASVPLNEGSNTLTARATDAGGRSGVATSTVFLDTTAPTIVSVTPAADATGIPTGIVVRVVFSEAIDPATVTAASFTLTPDAGGASVAASQSVTGVEADLLPTSALAAQTLYRIDVTTAVADLAGNPLAAAFRSRFTTGGSSAPTPPVLDPIPPALCATQITVTGRADPGARIRVTGGATVVTAVAGPDGRFSVDVALNPDQVNALVFVALDAQGNASAPVSASVRTDCTPPRVESAALDADDLVITFSEAMDPATVTLGASGSVTLAAASGELGSTLTLSSDGITARVTGVRPLSAETFTLTVNRNAKDLVGNALLAPFVKTFTPGLDIGLVGQVFDDRIGRPLPGVLVTVLAINGSAPPTPAPASTTDGEGRFGLVVPAGEVVLQAARDGFTAVTRIEVATAGQAQTVFDLRLTPEISAQAGPDGSASVTDAGLVLTLPAGSLAASAPLRAADLSPQGLAALTPLGWTSAAAAVLDLGGGTLAIHPASASPSSKRALSASASWRNRLAIAQGAMLLLARWDSPTRHFVAVGTATLSTDGTHIAASLPGEGAYAVLAPDPDPFAPPVPALGQPVSGVAPPDASPITSAAVTTDPTAVLPTQTADVTAELTLSAPVPSGYPVQALVSETLTLFDGSTIEAPSFLADLVIVRDGAGRALVPFRVRPSDTAGQVALSVGYENLQIKQYPFEVRRGDLLSPGGGVISGAGGFSLAVPAGALSATIPVNLSPIADPKNLPVPIPQGFTFLAAVDVSLGSNTLQLPAALRWGSPADPTGGGLVWLRASTIGGIARLQFIAPGRYDAANSWVETTPADVHQLPVPGVMTGGLYLLLSAQSPFSIAYAKGKVLDIGPQPLPGALVSEDANPFVSVADGSGNYGMAVPAAGTILRSSRIDTGNQGSAPAPSQATGATAAVDIQIQVTAPYVASVSPDTSSLLPLDLPVVFNISEPLDASTVNDASVTASGPAGAIAGKVTLSSNGTQVTFRPSLPWPGKASVTITLLSTVTDRNGYRLVDRTTRAISNFAATYTTIDPTPPNDVNPLLIAMGMPQGSPSAVRIIGAPGAACGGCTVTAINETTQATSSTTAAGDGSFSLTLAASSTDVVSILIQRPGGGGEIKINPGPFRDDGGRTALVGSRAADYITVDRIRVTLPDGTFSAPTTLKITPIAEAALPAPVPSLAKYTGAVSFDPGGAVAANPVDIGVSAPNGVTGGNFLVARAVTVLGEPRWMVVDTARYDNGEITTRPASGSSASSKPRIQGILLPAGTKATMTSADSAKNLLDRITRKSNLVFLELTSAFAFLEGTVPSPNAVVTFTFGAQYAYLASFIPPVWVAREAKQQSYFLVPIPTGADYTLTVRDGTTGFTLFQGNFSGVTDPTNITELPPGTTKADLPAPRLQSASPFSALTFVPVPTATGERRLLLPNIEYEFSPDASGQGNVNLYGAAGALPATVKATLQDNVGTGSATVATAADGSFGPLSVPAKQAEDLTFTAGTRALALDGAMRLGFTEPFLADSLKGQITLTDADGPP
ncbi:MAG TPA: Ig-like domain-containing protein, partial [Thermoanaerobaculia bacterium]|nr:Ig-like domain-containing protein [Thermoanaerobaculia bacterium]